MKLVVERIAEGFAVLENEDMSRIEVSIDKLPKGLKEGNVLFFDGINYSIDPIAEKEARQRIINKQKRVFGKR